MMRMIIQTTITVLGTALLFRVLEKRGVKSHGAFLGVPYDFRLPTWGRLKASFWNPRDRRLLTPHVFGWGYSINVPTALRWLRHVR